MNVCYLYEACSLTNKRVFYCYLVLFLLILQARYIGTAKNSDGVNPLVEKLVFIS